MISTSKNSNPNYLCKIFKIETLSKHPNADKLQICNIDFQPVVTGLDAKVDDVYVYFPVESKINQDFLSFTNSFRETTLNKDQTKKGFFEKNCRVRATKLRGEISCGYIVPIKELIDFTGDNTLIEYVGEYFDTINNIKIVEKYIPKEIKSSNNSSTKKADNKISRIIENQFRFHNDTENLRRNIWKINPNDYIGIHYKKHGTSICIGNVLVKKPLEWYEEFLKIFGVNIIDTEYDIVYSSRKVIKNEFETKDSKGFYDSDIWGEVTEKVKSIIPKGWMLYGEILGYTKTGQPIQKYYDYGCEVGEFKFYVYRITITNVDGLVIELDDKQIEEFCNKNNLNYSDTFLYYGKACELYPELDINNHWHENFIKNLERDYNEKDCFMCKNVVPEEGIVLRKNKLSNYEAYKLKSFRFIEKESKTIDEGNIDLETQES